MALEVPLRYHIEVRVGWTVAATDAGDGETKRVCEMAKRYIITLMAANRVGVLAAVGTALEELSANLHESSQTVMQGFCTIILVADFPDDRSPEVILDHLRDVSRPFSGEVCVRSPEAMPCRGHADEPTRQLSLIVSGRDKPGVLRTISGRLAERRVDINDLYGQRSDAGESFQLFLGLTVPADLDTSELRDEFHSLADTLGLTVFLQDVEDSSVSEAPRLKHLPVWFLKSRLSSDPDAG